MAEHPKLQTYTTMAVQGTAAITSSFDAWAAFCGPPAAYINTPSWSNS